jgi:pectinesterase
MDTGALSTGEMGTGELGAATTGTEGTGATVGASADPGTDGEASGEAAASDAADQGVLRPQLDEAAAMEHTILGYLASSGSVANPKDDPWDPTAGLPAVSEMVADYSVAPDGEYATVQSAVDAAIAAGGPDRVFIMVAAGSYRELVCIKGNTPITLYGTGATPAETTIVFDNYNGKAKTEEEQGNPCSATTGKTTYGTSGSATMAVTASDFHAKNLSIANDTDEATASGGLQAVALLTSGDQIVLDEVQLLGNQDTFYVKGVNAALITRVYVEDSTIAGDTDFIFGYARLVINNSTVHVVGDRRSDGVIVAPSTHAQNDFGILIANSTVTADEAITVVHLGRAWDESQGDVDSYAANVLTGDYPNGTAVFRDSVLDAPIADAAWSPAATTGRPFSAVATADLPANRLYEYGNSGQGATNAQ